MKLEDIHALLQDLTEVERVGPERLFARVIELYRTLRLADTSIDADGDMLLFQWGTYDWGQGPSFELDLTRQSIVVATDDVPDDENQGEMFQLRCCLHYPPSGLLALGAGNRWCHSPEELAEFTEYVFGHPAVTATKALVPRELELHVGRV